MPSGDSLELFPEDAAPKPSRGAPLADRMRPRTLDDVVGQDHLVGSGAPLRTLIAAGSLPSLLLWGPPGTGKTTLARLVASEGHGEAALFVALSAVVAGLKDVREIVADAERHRRNGQRTVFFLDEIHRFNRAQQDALLPHVEAGTITLVGATTENPSFEVIGPLLSRCRVFTLNALGPADLERLVERALTDPERGLGQPVDLLTPEARASLAEAAAGDARRALGMLETAVAFHLAGGEPEGPLDVEGLQRAIGERTLLYDRDREEHYNVISAFIKSLRASDPDASVYYLARMLDAGEDPLFVARRLVIFASEDVSNAAPEGLGLALAAYQAVERIGLPEGRIPLAHATTFLASAPKSNASYLALGRASAAVKQQGALPVPMHLRNAPTPFMKSEGYSEGYTYAHDAPEGFVPDRNLPAELDADVFYEPTDHGAEAEIAARVRDFQRRRDRRGGER